MIDHFDREILACLQTDNRQTAEELAEVVGLSPSAVHRRISKLREDRVIVADVAVVDPARVDRKMTFVVELMLEKVRAAEAAAIKKRLREAAEVQQCYNITGDADLLLIITARDVEDYEDISRRLFSADAGVRRYRTSVVMDRVKTSMAIPVTSTATRQAKRKR
ncbi:MAG: AsnC family transcriptional regulator [Alphaproteobacteria bacterium]|nr:AsnC family transcriptional regulator [Alphaproteobacteria bacterium]